MSGNFSCTYCGKAIDSFMAHKGCIINKKRFCSLECKNKWTSSHSESSSNTVEEGSWKNWNDYLPPLCGYSFHICLYWSWFLSWVTVGDFRMCFGLNQGYPGTWLAFPFSCSIPIPFMSCQRWASWQAKVMPACGSSIPVYWGLVFYPSCLLPCGVAWNSWPTISSS